MLRYLNIGIMDKKEIYNLMDNDMYHDAQPDDIYLPNENALRKLIEDTLSEDDSNVG